MANIAPLGKYRAFDEDGFPLNGGLLYTYGAGTSTPKATYTTERGDVPNANPTVLDAEGYANVWLGDGAYKFVLENAGGDIQFTTDDIGGTGNAAFGGQIFDISSNTAITSIYANSIINTTGTTTLSLLAAADAGSGFYFSLNVVSGTTTIDPDGTETINGSTTLVVTPPSTALIYCDGVRWRTLFLYVTGTAAAANIGTSGATVPLNNGNNTSSGNQTHSGTETFTNDINQTTSGISNINSSRTTSPGVIQQLASQIFSAFSSTSVSRVFVKINEYADAVTNAAELGKWQLQVISSGALSTEISAGGGVYAGSTTPQGVGTMNATAYYANGTVIPITKGFVSSEITYVASATQYSTAHSLGAVPVNWICVLRCKITEGGYAVGDEVLFPCGDNNSSFAFNIWANATNVGASQTGPLRAMQKSTNTQFTFTAANWRIVFKAQA